MHLNQISLILADCRSAAVLHLSNSKMSKAPLSIEVGRVIRIKRSRSFLTPRPLSGCSSLEETEIHIESQPDEYFHKSPGLRTIGRSPSFERSADYTDAPDEGNEHNGTTENVENCDGQVDHQIPVIDLADLDTVGGHAKLLAEISTACETWGFFQVVNHGVPSDLRERFLQVSKQFFNLPFEEKLDYNSGKVGNRVIYKPRDAAERRNYLDNLIILSLPVPEADVNGRWPSQPPGFRETVEEYNFESVLLQNRILALISESLALDSTYVEESNGDTRVVLMFNNYHACTSSEVDVGVRAHSDPHTITVLLQDGGGGLQVRKDECWVDVQPLPNSFVVNVGDLLQILSNGKYKSAEHRAVVSNYNTPRLSIVSCRTPADGQPIAPAPPLTVETPAKYPAVTYKEHLRQLLSTGLNGRRYLDATEIDRSIS